MKKYYILILLVFGFSSVNARVFKKQDLNLKLSYTHILSGTDEIGSRTLEVRYSSDEKFCLIIASKTDIQCKYFKELRNSRGKIYLSQSYIVLTSFDMKLLAESILEKSRSSNTLLTRIKTLIKLNNGEEVAVKSANNYRIDLLSNTINYISDDDNPDTLTLVSKPGKSSNL